MSNRRLSDAESVNKDFAEGRVECDSTLEPSNGESVQRPLNYAAELRFKRHRQKSLEGPGSSSNLPEIPLARRSSKCLIESTSFLNRASTVDRSTVQEEQDHAIFRRMRYVPKQADPDDSIHTNDSCKYLASLTHSKSERSGFLEYSAATNRDELSQCANELSEDPGIAQSVMNTERLGTGRRCLSPRSGSFERIGVREKRTISPRGRQIISSEESKSGSQEKAGVSEKRTFSPRGRQIIASEEKRNVSPRGRQIVSVRDDRRSVSPGAVERRGTEEKRAVSPRGRIVGSPRGRQLISITDDRRSVSPRGRTIHASERYLNAENVVSGTQRRKSVCENVVSVADRDPATQFRAPGGVFRRNNRHIPAIVTSESELNDSMRQSSVFSEQTAGSSPRASTAPEA